MTLLGLVSDSHDNLALCEQAARFFRERRPDLVLHLGDIVTGPAVHAFEGLPMQFLRGNNDEDELITPALRECGFPPLVSTWRGELQGIRLGAAHGHKRRDLRRLREVSDVVLHGHTHKLRAEQEEGALVVNPGALYRAPVRTLALVALPEKAVTFYRVGRGGVEPL